MVFEYTDRGELVKLTAHDADLFVLPYADRVIIQIRVDPLGPTCGVGLSEEQARDLVDFISGEMSPASVPLGLSMTPVVGDLFIADRNAGYLRIRVWPTDVDGCATWTDRDGSQIEMLRMVTQRTCRDIAA